MNSTEYYYELTSKDGGGYQLFASKNEAEEALKNCTCLSEPILIEHKKIDVSMDMPVRTAYGSIIRDRLKGKKYLVVRRMYVSTGCRYRHLDGNAMGLPDIGLIVGESNSIRGARWIATYNNRLTPYHPVRYDIVAADDVKIEETSAAFSESLRRAGL